MIKCDKIIKSGNYEAAFSGDMAGNCYLLRYKGVDILRSPESEEQLNGEVFLFGNPILFPPNRIYGGEFEFNGRKYSFPINEPDTGCHLHGELYKKPFKCVHSDQSSVSFELEAKENEYLGFPHAFRLGRHYELHENGLTESVTVTNLSDKKMPFMLAFHTTFALNPDHGYKLYAPVVREQLRNEKYLPTLRYASDRAREKALISGDYEVKSSAISALYELDGNVTELRDTITGLKIRCESDNKYRYRMIWRRENADFLCIEPQTCAIDCFHLSEPPEQNGLLSVMPGESLTLTTRITVTE